MRSIESGGGGGGTGWALSCSTAYMVRDGEEPRTTLARETTALAFIDLTSPSASSEAGGDVACDPAEFTRHS